MRWLLSSQKFFLGQSFVSRQSGEEWNYGLNVSDLSSLEPDIHEIGSVEKKMHQGVRKPLSLSILPALVVVAVPA
jgi:hypothetical protein